MHFFLKYLTETQDENSRFKTIHVKLLKRHAITQEIGSPFLGVHCFHTKILATLSELQNRKANHTVFFPQNIPLFNKVACPLQNFRNQKPQNFLIAQIHMGTFWKPMRLTDEEHSCEGDRASMGGSEDDASINGDTRKWCGKHVRKILTKGKAIDHANLAIPLPQERK
ncbi:hypothetical protein CEXT_259491 [Caerostris extrusa]|uniref:Uncharacterized protein n=1 Tax=Caerostris extrusa TaxID=172846 RepID=A0AAV4WE29_CAEEX|nr:hypothetical protein CEXT_259491 [Caerostris extrusa]